MNLVVQDGAVDLVPVDDCLFHFFRQKLDLSHFDLRLTYHHKGPVAHHKALLVVEPRLLHKFVFDLPLSDRVQSRGQHMVRFGVASRNNPDCAILQSVIVPVVVVTVLLTLERVICRQYLSFRAEL